MSHKVAFQGEAGAYSEQAARAVFGDRVQVVPYSEFASVFRAVTRGRATRGVVPIENSLAGSVHQNYDLLQRHNITIVGEVECRVQHNLLAVEGATEKTIRSVYSHPQALTQCEGFLRSRARMNPVPFFDTAGSAKYVAERGRKDEAAIASLQAAETYGLRVLRRSLEDLAENYTRFLVLKKAGARPAPRRKGVTYKTSLIMSLKNIPGALHKALSIFAIRDIDLTKIESRPIPGRPWESMFYLDCNGHERDEPCERAFTHLEELTTYQRVLGSYPKG